MATHLCGYRIYKCLFRANIEKILYLKHKALSFYFGHHRAVCDKAYSNYGPGLTITHTWHYKGKFKKAGKLVYINNIEENFVELLAARVFYHVWSKVFRIIPEFRILRLTFNGESASKH